MPQRADKRFRITRRRDIARLFEQGQRASDGFITLIALPADAPIDHSRGGVAVSKRHGGAVRRNRIKRLCREAFRLSHLRLPVGWDFMIIPRVGAEPGLQALQDSIRSLAKRLVGQSAGKDAGL